MVRYGFIHTKEDIKFLVLFAMDLLPFPVTFETVVDLITWCDDGFGYFELSEAFYEMIPTGHIDESTENGVKHYTITEKGRKVAQELAYDLPRSVREKAVTAVLRYQNWARKEARYSADITERADGHCTIRCTVKGLDSDLFCLALGMPDRLTAELVKKQFILKGNEIYQLLINKLTEEEKQ